MAAAFVSASVMYYPALRSAFFADDYVYLDAVKNMSFSHYVHTALVPASESDRLIVAKDFWRPLYFLSFEFSVRLFGRQTEWYHLANLAVHLANIGLVWLVAVRMGASRMASALGAAVFAVHPAAIGAVAWISSFNSIGFTFALAALLAFIAAVRSSGRPRVRLHCACVALFVAGLLFRESAVSVLGLAFAWYLLVEARSQLLVRRTWLEMLPLGISTFVYCLVRTKGMTVPLSNPVLGARYGSHVWSHGWWYVKLAVVPHPALVADWAVDAQRVGGAALVGLMGLAALFRRWLLLACLVGFAISIVPAASIQRTVDARYFYFSGAVLGVALAALATEFERLPVAGVRTREWALAAGTMAVLALGTGYGLTRVQKWVDDFPAVHQAWVDEFRAENPTLAAGARVYAGGTPAYLAIFGGVSLKPTLAEYYPDIGNVVLFDVTNTTEKPAPQQGDVVFIYRGRGSTAGGQ
jgi:hypothetical protein